jgi:5-methylcytosine-specific restriction endonuclease McrA
MKSYALQKISKSGQPSCVYCGCDFLRTLEINHKDCNRKNLEEKYGKPESGYSFYKRIVDGDRPTEDLEITCGVCNKNHYFQRKFGLKWKVTYESPKFTKA